LPLHQAHIGGVDSGACIHIGRQHTGSDGDIVRVGSITDPRQRNGDPLLIGYTGEIHRHRTRAAAAHTEDASSARSDAGALYPKRSIETDSSWESEYNLSNSTVATFNARGPPKWKIDIEWHAIMRFARNGAHRGNWKCIFPKPRLCVSRFLYDKPSASRDDIGPAIGQSSISAQSPVRVVGVDSAW